MHRHSYKGRKFGRERDQRRALMRGLSIALVEHGSIETTLPKAKDLRPMVEKLVTKARKGDLHNRRQIIDTLANISAAHKLVDVIAPAMKRESGYLRIEKTTLRKGDNTQLARISFVDEIKDTSDQPEKATAGKTPTIAAHDKKEDKEKAIKTTNQPAATTTVKAVKAKPATTKRTGVRGNK
jgi:large subunit ribosomal protein L17